MIYYQWLKPFYLSLIIFNLIISLIHVTGAIQDERELEKLSVPVDTNENERLRIVPYPNRIEEDIEDIEETEESDDRNFSWEHHREDHGMYSGRSLMSAKDMKPNLEDEQIQDIQSNYDHDSSNKNSKLEKSKLNDESSNPLETIDYAEKEWQLMFRSLDLAYESMSSSLIQDLGKQTNLFEEIISNVKPECRREINHIRDSVRQHKLWALRMIDSNGKIPSGVTYGRFASPGDYEECLSVRVDEYVTSPNEIRSSNNIKTSNKNNLEHHKFHGKYCLIDFRLPLPERPRDKLLSIHEPVLNLTGTKLAEQFPEIKNYSAYASIFYEIGYLHGFCLPSTCDIIDMTQSIGKALEGLHVIVNSTVDCQEISETPIPFRKSQIISLTILGILFLNAFLASFVYHLQTSGQVKATSDHQANKNATKKIHQDTLKHSNDEYNESKEFKPNQLLGIILKNKFYSNCFSIQKNFERLTKPDPRGLAFVHYTRIVAMALTVITHTAALGTLQAITKPADASNSEQIFRDFIPQMLANAFTSIQIFFFMAGFMLVISTYPSIRRDKGHLSFVEYAIKRAIRLMPGLAATICINFLWPLFVDGPMLTYFIRMIVVPCETNWWRTLGFLSNFDHVEKMCLRHSYFSASDYQLHLMAFPMLILLYKQPILALILAGILTISGFVAQVIMVLTKTLLPFMMVDYIDKEAFFNVVHYIHHPVWNHISAFFYGFIIGYMVVKQIRIQIKPETIKRIWCILLPIGIASIFAPYFWNHYKRPIYRWQMVIYVIVDRFIVLTTCAWISYATMVLARKPRKTQPSNSPKVSENSNYSNARSITTHSQPNLPHVDEPARITSNEQVVASVVSMDQIDASRLEAVGSQISIPRQRSSPNIHSPQEVLNQAVAPERFSRTISSINLSKTSANETSNNEKMATAGCQTTDVSAEEAKKVDSIKSDDAQPKHQVSNVNTLCLILSRLTFQLYLFNMVALWIDVNHSKYFWFFSYYFILMKSFAIYIGSAIFAMVFFITMESPSLTLYIAWVKSRAVARANKQLPGDDLGGSAQRQGPNDGNVNSFGAKTTTGRLMGGKFSPDVGAINHKIPPALNPVQLSPSSTASSGRSTVGKSFDGLCMKTGHLGSDKSAFSYIDLSNPAGSPLEPLESKKRSENKMDDQTSI